MSNTMTLKLPTDYSMNQRDNQYQRRMQQDQKLLDLKKWFKRNYKQIQIEGIPYFKLVKMFQFIQENGGVFAKPKQAPKKEQMFREIEYYVKLAEADQKGKKLSKEQLMHLFKFELQQLSMSQRKQLLEEFKISREFHETMRI